MRMTIRTGDTLKIDWPVGFDTPGGDIHLGYVYRDKRDQNFHRPPLGVQDRHGIGTHNRLTAVDTKQRMSSVIEDFVHDTDQRLVILRIVILTEYLATDQVDPIVLSALCGREITPADKHNLRTKGFRAIAIGNAFKFGHNRRALPARLPDGEGTQCIGAATGAALRCRRSKSQRKPPDRRRTENLGFRRVGLDFNPAPYTIRRHDPTEFNQIIWRTGSAGVSHGASQGGSPDLIRPLQRLWLSTL